jgi:hypothetical protein
MTNRINEVYKNDFKKISDDNGLIATVRGFSIVLRQRNWDEWRQRQR